MKKVMKSKNQCEKYGLAITDYVLGEEMDISREELFNHIATCENCQKDLANWRNDYAALRNKAYFEKPETKKKYQEMLNRVKSSPARPESIRDSQCGLGDKLPDGIDVNINLEYGWYAGTLWHHLGEYGPVRLEDIPEKINADMDKVKYVTGWLMGEKKVCMKQAKDSLYIYLTKEEQEKYHQIKGKTTEKIDQAQG